MKNEIVLFTDGELEIEVAISPDYETVWLTQKQMGQLYDVKQATISEHINNIISAGELDETSIGFSDRVSPHSRDCPVACPVEQSAQSLRNPFGLLFYAPAPHPALCLRLRFSVFVLSDFLNKFRNNRSILC